MQIPLNPRRWLGRLAAIAFAALVVTSCGQKLDRAEAVSSLQSDLGLTEATAECVVDGIVEELGADAFGDSLTDEQALAIVAQLDRCQSVAPDPVGSGIATADTAVTGDAGPSFDDEIVDTGDTTSVWSAPVERLDELTERCGAGDDQACDGLFWESPPNSPYEDFGWTCGGSVNRTFPCSS